MSKPILSKVLTAFNAALAQTISFSYSGSQVYANNLYIYDNDTNALVYSEKQTTMQLKHVLPANSLINGKSYTFKVSAFDINNTESVMSDGLLIKTLTAPVFALNVANEQTITTSYLAASVSYSQNEGEELSECQLILYSSNKILISDSGKIFDETDLNYNFTGLSDGEIYYIRAIATTLNGLSLDSGYISFTVNYHVPALETIVNLTNIEDDGAVMIQSGIKMILVECSAENPIYINSSSIDLRNGEVVSFYDGFTVNGDFTLELQGENIGTDIPFFTMSNQNDTINLLYGINDFLGSSPSKAYFLLRVSNGVSEYVLHSSYLDVPLSTDTLNIWLRRKNGLYELKIANLH